MSTRSNETIRAYMVSISVLGESIGNPEVHTVGRVEIDKFIADRMAASREASVEDSKLLISVGLDALPGFGAALNDYDLEVLDPAAITGH